MTSRSGVVVAGGRSTRFGDRDKAVADLAGEPMIRRVADAVADRVDELVVNCRDGQRARIDDALAGLGVETRFAVDRVPDRGPVAGVRAGLRAAAGEYAAVVACDMPFVTPDAVGYLFDCATGATGAVPLVAGTAQPFPAVVRVEPAADACSTALADGDARMAAVLDLLAPVFVADSDPAVARNVNTREALAAAVADLD